MNLKLMLKRSIEDIPYPLGKWLARIPFKYRLGGNYEDFRKIICASLSWSDDLVDQYSVAMFSFAFERAKCFPCYRKLYENAGVLNISIKSISDIKKLPTIDKDWVRKNVDEFSGPYKLFTGGTTGVPIPLYMDKNCWAREWAHMHWIWSRVGYSYRDIKATLRGKNMGNRPFEYNPVHNEFRLNTYLPVTAYKDNLLELFKKHSIRYFHPFPSSMHDFILDLERTCTKEEIGIVLGGIKGVLLSSEFPAPYMIEKYRQYKMPYVSWYGHSEMCILAYDDSGRQAGAFANCYKTFPTYGLCEVEGGHLIGSSFYNTDMPLLRYDTGDLVDEKERSRGGICREFSIKEGRGNDYVLDKNGKRFSLTALIYGRHHKVFDIADHVQISQNEAGKAIFIVSGQKDILANKTKSDLFDLTNVAIDFDLEIVSKPIRTTAGKLKLKL